MWESKSLQFWPMYSAPWLDIGAKETGAVSSRTTTVKRLSRSARANQWEGLPLPVADQTPFEERPGTTLFFTLIGSSVDRAGSYLIVIVAVSFAWLGLNRAEWHISDLIKSLGFKK